MLTHNLHKAFSELKVKYGGDSIIRVEEMLERPHNKLNLQKSCKYVLPNLSQGGWKNIDDYTEVKKLAEALRSSHHAIKKEFLYSRKAGVNLPGYQHHKIKLDNWRALYIYKGGAKLEEQSQENPTISKIFDEKIKDIICPLGEVHFSILKPHTHVPLHSDLWNFALNLHFAVVIPENCAISVVGEKRTWKEGECLLFDYSFEHEAWNNSDKERICILMDIWHPEVTLAERLAIVALFKEINSIVGMN